MASETTAPALAMLRIPDLLKDWPWDLKINPSYSQQLHDEEVSFICGLPVVQENVVLQKMVQKALSVSILALTHSRNPKKPGLIVPIFDAAILVSYAFPHVTGREYFGFACQVGIKFV
jgi:hypothetical protein